MSSESEHYQHLKEIFLAAVELKPAARSAYLEEACAGDPKLRAEVARLIRREEDQSDFLERPALEEVGLVPPAQEETITLAHGLLPPPSEDPRFKNWDRYEILEQIGKGGMGEVYTAHDPRLKRTVAIKFVRHGSDQQEARFRREAEAHARVEHENVVKIYETGLLGDQLFLAMQFVDGPTLMGVRHETTLEQKARLVRQVATGMHAAHREGLIHRDIKPSNILIETTEEGEFRPYITDFGLAADLLGPGLTATGEMMGTPSYMAPERIRPGDQGQVDRRTDVYSLGATFFEFLLGRAPFEADSTLSLLLEIQNAEPTKPRKIDPSLPVELEAILLKCLEKEPQDRYTSARALADDLDRFLDGEPVAARSTSLGYRLRKKIRKHRTGVAASLVAVAILASGAGWGLQSKISARRQAQVVQRLGHRVMELEYLGRVAHVAPLHDIRAENQLIRDRLEDMEQEVATEGRFAEGPVAAALGRVHLALFDYERAREELEKAWDVGYREGSVAYALGRTLGAIYEAQAALADQIDNRRLRDQRKDELRTTLLVPAIEYLSLGKTAALDSEGFVEAVISRYEERYDDALVATQSLHERASWQYEAHKLEGDIHVARGEELRDEGSFDEAEIEYRSGEAAYLAALDVARSDVRLYESLCRLEDSRMEMVVLRAQDPSPWFESGTLWCGRATRVDPDRGLAYRLLANLYTRQGQSASQEPAQVETALSQAASNARAAIDRAPDDSEAYRALGLALSQQARFDLNGDRNPLPAVDEASVAFETSLELHPDLAVSHTQLAEVLILRYSWESRHDMDPRESLINATASFEIAMSKNPDLATLTARIAPLHLARARWELAHDIDPLASTGDAVLSFQAALAENPTWIQGHEGLGSAHAVAAIWEHSQGLAATSPMEKAVVALDRALELSPNLPDARLQREEITLLEARNLLAAGESADQVVERGLNGVRSFLERRPEDERGLELLAELEALAGS